jgi:hypothetical protein
MIDPSNALHSFQKELLNGRIQLQCGTVYPDLYVYHDEPEIGKFRFTYVQLENNTVTAFVILATCAPIERVPCFQIGYAVPKEYRSQGRAKEAVQMAISEMKHGFQKARVATFYIEAIVGADNKPSQRVAEQTISATSANMIDEISGLPSLQYLRKIE